MVDDKNFLRLVSSLYEDRKIEIIFSGYVFDELVCTWLKGDEQSRERTRELFQCALSLMSDKVLRQRQAIIENEINYFFGNTHHLDVFLDSKETINIKHTIENLANGKSIVNEECLLNIKKEKKNSYVSVKAVVKKHKIHVLESSPYDNFDDWYNNPEVVKYERDLIIKRLLVEQMHLNVNSDIVKKVQENKSNLIHLNASLRMDAAYQFALLVYKKPLIGDFYDMKHFVCSATIDILVCDGDFLNMLQWVYPEKRCCTTADFLDSFCYHESKNNKSF
jgi:hypothetical protein